MTAVTFGSDFAEPAQAPPRRPAPARAEARAGPDGAASAADPRGPESRPRSRRLGDVGTMGMVDGGRLVKMKFKIYLLP